MQHYYCTCIFQGNVTKTVNLVVIDSTAPQCEKNTTKTNKGIYIWKETIAGVTKELPCKVGDGKVTHKCDRHGVWSEFNSSQCAFTNEDTRTLQSIAEVIYGMILVILKKFHTQLKCFTVRKIKQIDLHSYNVKAICKREMPTLAEIRLILQNFSTTDCLFETGCKFKIK